MIEIIRAEKNLIPSFYDALVAVASERVFIETIGSPPFEKVSTFQTNLIETGAPVCYAVESSKVVGWCDIHVSDNPRLNHRGGLGMGVINGYRSKGLGSRLMSAALIQAKGYGLEKIELHVYSSNAGAIALYEKFGFEREGLIRHYRKLDGEYFDCIVMAKFL